MRLTKKTAIKACRHDDPLANEMLRYAGSGVITIDGWLILTRPKRSLVKPWVEHNLMRLASFGIKGELIQLK